MTKHKPTYRKIFASLYNDPDWLTLPPNLRWLYVVMLTGSQSNSIGCYVCRLSVLSEDAGFEVTQSDIDRVCHTMRIRYLIPYRILFIPNWLKWNQPDSSKVLVGYIKSLSSLPKCDVVDTLSHTLSDTLSEIASMRGDGTGFTELWDRLYDSSVYPILYPMVYPMAYQEPEPEPEPEPYPYPKPQPYPQPKPKPNNIAPAARGAVKFNPMLHVEIPEWLGEHWAMWCTHRLEIKKPLTKSQSEMTIKKLVEWGPERAKSAIRHSIEKGYQGLFEPDAKHKQKSKMTLQEELQGHHDFAVRVAQSMGHIPAEREVEYVK